MILLSFYEVATTCTCLALKTTLGSPGLQQTVAPAEKLSCFCCSYTFYKVFTLLNTAPCQAIAILYPITYKIK